ncbi:MAG: LamG domain-containing protein, partial [Victivallales bacterium]|nr:LamG domain-containing protein [Victivallales bacterium]
MKTIRAFAIALLISSMLFAAGWDFPRQDNKHITLDEIPNWGSEGFTAEVWCRPDEADCGYAVLMQGSFGLPKFEGENSYLDYLKLTDGAEPSARFKLPLELGRFHHYVMTGTPEQICHYRDGKLLQTQKGPGIPKYTSTSPFYVGSSNGWHHQDFVGNVALIRLYSRALTPTEVAAHYGLLQARQPLPDYPALLLDDDYRFSEPDGKTKPADFGKKVTVPLDNTVKDAVLHGRSRHFEGRQERKKPLVDFEDLEGWKMTYVSGEVVPSFRRSKAYTLWGEYVLRAEFKEGYAPNPKAKVVLEPPAPIRIPNDFDAVAVWRFATEYVNSVPAMWFSIQWRDPEGKLHDSGKMDNLLEVGWGLKMAPMKETMKAGSEFVSITFTGFNEPKRVLYLDNLVFYERSKAPLTDAYVPTYEELGVPNRPETILPTAAEPTTVTLETIAPNHWRFTSTGTATGQRLCYDIRPATGTLSDIQATWNGKTFTPMQGGGFRWAMDNIYPVKENSLLDPASPRITATLASATATDDTLTLTWNYRIDKKLSRTAKWVLSLKGNTLIIDLASDLGKPDGNVGEFQFGAIDGIAGKVVEIPYLNWGKWFYQKSNPPGVFVADDCCIFAMLDWYNSDASGLFGASSATPRGHWALDPIAADYRWILDGDTGDPTNTIRDHSVVNGGSYYWPTTAGRRNPVRERLMLTVADKLANVLPNIPHPPNPDIPLTRNDVWCTRMWYITSPTPDYFGQELAMWQSCRDYGMEHLNVRLHCNINRMYWPERFDEPITFIKPFTTPDIGGDEALAAFCQDIKGLGYRIGLYTNAVLLSEMSFDAWDEDMMNQDPNGHWLYSFGNTNQTKTSRLLPLQRKWYPSYAEQFAPTCAYHDQITSPPCWRYTDYDARAPEAGKFSAPWRVFAESLREVREEFGPVLSEGATHLFFAGLCDSYAQPQRWTMNVIPDFNLRKIHPLSNDCGYGLSLVEEKAKYGDKHFAHKLLAYEYAYGSIGHIADCYYGTPRPSATPAMIASYFLIEPMQKFYAGVKIKEILYNVDGQYLPFEAAVKAGTLSRNQVKLIYENGLEVAANLNASENMSVTLNGMPFELPPDGFAAVTADRQNLACSALQNGQRVDMCLCTQDGLLYCDNAPANPLLHANGAYLLKRLSDNIMELTPAPFTAEETVDIAIDAATVVVEHYARDGKLLGTDTLPVADGHLTIPITQETFKYVLKK